MILTDLAKDLKLYILYKHNKKKMKPCLRQMGIGEFGKGGFRVRYPTFYWAIWDIDKKFNYSPDKRKTKELELMSLGDGKMIIYDEWSGIGNAPKEDNYLKNKDEWLKKAKIGVNDFRKDSQQ